MATLVRGTAGSIGGVDHTNWPSPAAAGNVARMAQNNRPPRRKGAAASTTAATTAVDFDVLAELQSRDDSSLATLLQARPELLHPIAADLERLAQRAMRPESINAVLLRLDRWQLQVLEALTVIGPTTVDDLTTLMNVTDVDLRSHIESALTWLNEALLVARSGVAVAVYPEVAAALGPYPAGLGPSVRASHPQIALLADSADRLQTLLEQAPQGAVAALQRLAAGPPVGRVPDAQRVVTLASAKTPVEWLLAQGLLIAIAADEVVLPREVGLALRSGRVIVDPQPEAPEGNATAFLSAAQVDQAMGLAANKAVHDIVRLLDLWAANPPGVLRSGGLGVRDLAEAAKFLDRDERSTAVLVEAAFSAGLLASDGDEDAPSWLPTPSFDLWQAKEVAEQWAMVVYAWATATRTTTLDLPDVPNTLSPKGEHHTVPALRLEALECIAAATTVTDESVRAALAWRLPRAPEVLRDAVADATVADSEVWGLVVGTTPARIVSTVVRAAAEHRESSGRVSVDTDLAAAITPFVPEPVDHMLLQADLTAVVPGPPESGFARELTLLADLESTGGASVYRFSETSIRRALDAGWAANDVVVLLQRRSRTPLPQSLTTMIDDLARRHGSVRVGRSLSYVRSDDAAALAMVVSHKATSSLSLRLLAPTVAVSPAPPDEVVAALRAAGMAPAVESLDGVVLLADKQQRRAPQRPRPTPASRSLAPDEGLLAAAVRALRAGEIARADTPAAPRTLPPLQRTSSAETVVALRTLVQRGGPILLGYAGADGSLVERIVEPIRLDGGRLLGIDRHTDRVTHFSVARITGVAALTPPDDDILASEART